jgi:hypothetical protein
MPQDGACGYRKRSCGFDPIFSDNIRPFISQLVRYGFKLVIRTATIIIYINKIL